jgi:hypothetical protein
MSPFGGAEDDAEIVNNERDRDEHSQCEPSKPGRIGTPAEIVGLPTRLAGFHRTSSASARQLALARPRDRPS